MRLVYVTGNHVDRVCGEHLSAEAPGKRASKTDGTFDRRDESMKHPAGRACENGTLNEKPSEKQEGYFHQLSTKTEKRCLPVRQRCRDTEATNQPSLHHLT